MASIPCVGRCFTTAAAFMDYLETVKFDLWRPKYVVMHHTGVPNRAQWDKYQTRNPPISDEQWMRNLARYYGEEMGWSAGPHFFVTPKHYCVLSPPNRRGVHAASFNSASWGVEVVGDFDREDFSGVIKERAAQALAVLHVAAGLQPMPFVRGQRGLHFHRDDPKTRKTCPGIHVLRDDISALVVAKMEELTPGDHEDDKVEPAAPIQGWRGVVNVDDLNVRASAAGAAPMVRKIDKGTEVVVEAQAMNGPTKWLRIGDEEWVAARFIDAK